MLPRDIQRLNNANNVQQAEIRRKKLGNGGNVYNPSGIQLTPSYILDRTADNIYLNVTIDHSRVSTNDVLTGIPGVFPENARYDITKTLPILDKCSDYYMSIIRFSIPLDEVPIMVMPVMPNQPNSNLTPYVIGIQYLGVNYPVQINYIPQNNEPVPVQNLNTQVITPYYFVYNYQIFINMVNTALQTAYVNAGLNVLSGGIPAPYFYLDPATNLISLIVHISFTELWVPLTGIPLIYMNTPLSGFFGSFNLFYEATEINPAGNDSHFILYGSSYPKDNLAFTPFGVAITAGTIPPVAAARPYYYKFTQEFTTLEYWSSLKSIIISTNTIPINNEFIPTRDNTSSVNSSAPIIADFIPFTEGNVGETRSVAFYTPPVYKLIDLESDGPLQKIDINVYWEDNRNNVYPLQVSLLNQVNIKIGFFKKSLYKNIEEKH